MNQKLQQQLVDYAQILGSSGLSSGRSGNLSTRCQQGFLITPSALDYRKMTSNDIVWVDSNGRPEPGQKWQPSSEWRFHCELYRTRPDINAVVHAHPIHCTALACCQRNIPAFHYMVAIAGGKEIPLADYALFGTEDLCRNITAELRQHNACLLANHGMVAVGTNVEQAFNLALEVETLAQQYCEALKLGGVKILSDQQMDEVINQFKSYGQRS